MLEGREEKAQSTDSVKMHSFPSYSDLLIAALSELRWDF